MTLNFSRTSNFRHLIILIAVLLSLLMAWANILSDCVPHDEGLLGQSALRFTNGELPHIDFDDPYTGLLNLIHATAFRVGGVAASSLRYMNFLIFSLVLMLFSWYIRNYLSLPGSILAIFSFTLWSIMIYPAAMPSWYVSYLVFLAALMIVKKPESSIIIFIAGIFLGLATLIKINSVLFLIASLWGLVALAWRGGQRELPGVEKIAVFALYLLTNCLFWIVLAQSFDPTHIFYFYLPSFILITLLVNKLLIEELSPFLAQIILLMAGYILTLALYVLFFHLNGGLSELLHGIFIAPLKRMDSASFPPPHWSVVITVILVLIATTNILRKEGPRSAFALGVAIVSGWGFFLVAGTHSLSLASVSMIPLALIMSIFIFKIRPSGDALFWLLMASFGILVQYPYYSSSYVGYTSIFTIIALLLGIVSRGSEKRTLQYRELALILLFLAGAFVQESRSEQFPQSAQSPPYCVSDQLLALIENHSRKGDSILAFPDSPEVYFFSGRTNPTREMYDFLSSDNSSYDNYLELAKESDIPVIVINQKPCCSKKVEEERIDSFREFYLEEKIIGDYLVLFGKIK